MKRFTQVVVFGLLMAAQNVALAHSDVMIFGAGFGLGSRGQTAEFNTVIKVKEQGRNDLDARCEQLAQNFKQSLDEVSQATGVQDLFKFEATKWIRTSDMGRKDFMCSMKVAINGTSYKFKAKETEAISLVVRGEDPTSDANMKALGSHLLENVYNLNYFQSKRSVLSFDHYLRYIQVVKNN